VASDPARPASVTELQNEGSVVVKVPCFHNTHELPNIPRLDLSSMRLLGFNLLNSIQSNTNFEKIIFSMARGVEYGYLRRKKEINEVVVVVCWAWS
jgi:hypothetical protein